MPATLWCQAQHEESPSPAREACIADAVSNAEMILKKIDQG